MTRKEKQRLKQEQLFAEIGRDPVATARAIRLKYVNDQQPGFRRKRYGSNFHYYDNDQRIKDTETLLRIRKLVIPPAWENVWICRYDNGHIQCTGIDQKGRKQYRYHPLWNSFRNETKFHRMLEFGSTLENVRAKLNRHLSQRELTREKVLAAIVSIMDKTSIRVGNSAYEKLYGSFGISTLKDKHVQFTPSTVTFSFKGKKGVYHSIGLKSRKLANIVRQCRDIPGRELFQYLDADGVRNSVDSGEVNEYIKELTEGEFSSKDFRTWKGTVQALIAFAELGDHENPTQMNKNVVAALDTVAAHLGNTRTVCKKHYVHPLILDGYEQKKLQRHFDILQSDVPLTTDEQFERAEKLLLNLLREGLD